MGDLDTSLIREFSMRPAFYNKTCHNYKDKLYVDRAWQEISEKIGYEVSMLKDRMYQLRNRYNLEKRKVQSLKDEGVRNPKSTWPLFRHLDFLDGHIRPRKSYKSMMKKCIDTTGLDADDFDYVPPGKKLNLSNIVTKGMVAAAANDTSMHMVEVKYEREEDIYPNDNYENETEDDRTTSTSKISNNHNGEYFLNPANFLDEHESGSENNDRGSINVPAVEVLQQSVNNLLNPTLPNSGLTLRNINTLRRKQAVSHQHQQQQQQEQPAAPLPAPQRHSTPLSIHQQLQQQQNESLLKVLDDNDESPCKAQQSPAKHQSSDKYRAFGSFVAASLQDLPEKQALELIEKFTNDIVRNLISSTSTNLSISVDK